MTTAEQDPTLLPWIGSDRDDYPPGSYVRLSSGDWQPGEQVEVYVNDHASFSWSRRVTVTADEYGQFLDEFTLPNWFVAEFSVVATGELSGVATHRFLDSVAAASSNTAAGTGGLVTINTPSGVTAGDVLIAQITAVEVNGNATSRFICPTVSGWTSAIKTAHTDSNKVMQEIFWRRVGSTAEPTSYTFDLRASSCNGNIQNRGIIGGIGRYTGVVSTGDPVANSAALQGGSANTANTPAVATTVGHGTTRIVRFVGVFKTSNITHASLARIYHRSASSPERSMAAFDGGDQAAGSAGTQVGITLQSAGEWIGQTIALREGAVANTAPTADSQTVTTDEEGAKLITLTGADADGDSLTFKVTSLPADGKLYKGNSSAAADEITAASLAGPVTLAGATVTYKPNLNYNSTVATPDTFKFIVSDASTSSGRRPCRSPSPRSTTRPSAPRTAPPLTRTPPSTTRWPAATSTATR
ncbi:MAG: hypothetical protein M3153_06405 [Chloroflexota bacterium]|nr:hypothetical protein [Chloroflexota bacterium]